MFVQCYVVDVAVLLMFEFDICSLISHQIDFVVFCSAVVIFVAYFV